MPEPSKPKSEPRSEYLHGSDAAEQERLEALALMLGGADFLPPLKPGMRILEVGCGTGAIARDTASRMPDGEVVGLDRSKEQLDTARRLAKQKSVNNVSFVRGEAGGLDFPDATFDAAYCRFVLEHAPTAEPIVREMARVVRPGGWVCALEWENGAGVLHPAAPAACEVWQALYRLQNEMGGDAWVARKLYGAFVSAGLSDVEATGRSWTATAAQRDKLQFYVGGAREIIAQGREQMLARGMVTPDLLDDAHRDYERLLQDPSAYIYEGFCRALGGKA